MKALATCLLGTLLCSAVPALVGQQTGTAAKVVAWEIKPGVERDFEEGYKRHLAWHRKNADPWTWHGWMLVSGERLSYFVDGSFFHKWADFDNSVKPAEDGADNAVNVDPYGITRTVGFIEGVPELSKCSADDLKSPLMIFARVEIEPGSEAKFESALGSAFRDADLAEWQRMVFRPVNGMSEYLLMVPVNRQAELPVHRARLSRLMQRAQDATNATRLVTGVETELGRYRTDLSYIP